MGKGDERQAPLTFRELQNEVSEWSQRNFPNNEPIDPFLGVVEEVGEVSHAILKGRQKIRGKGDEALVKAAVADGVADILIYLADFCARNRIDMQQTVEEVWAKVSRRDWQANPDNAAEVAGE